MDYTDPTLGYAFRLPATWRVDRTVNPLTFFGPEGRIGAMTQLVQIRTGGIGSQYVDPANRETFMAEPGATVRRGVLGPESNVVVCEWADHTEISAVRDGIQYSIVHPHDAETRAAIQCLCDTFRFPSQDRAVNVLLKSANPSAQTMSAVLNATSSDEIHRILASSTAVKSVRHGKHGTEYVLKRPEGERRKWWQFWKP
jgi:hypothetical protein